jgi:hypothetical protein
MSNTRPNIPLNDCILSTLWAGVEVSCEPLGVHACHLPVLLIPWDVRGSKANHLSDGVPPPDKRRHPTNRSAVDRKTKDHDNILQRHHNLARWKVERVVSRCHQSMSVVNAAASTSGRPWLMSRASGRNPARRMNGSYHSSHSKGLCMWILSGFKCFQTQQQ